MWSSSLWRTVDVMVVLVGRVGRVVQNPRCRRAVDPVPARCAMTLTFDQQGQAAGQEVGPPTQISGGVDDEFRS